MVRSSFYLIPAMVSLALAPACGEQVSVQTLPADATPSEAMATDSRLGDQGIAEDASQACEMCSLEVTPMRAPTFSPPPGSYGYGELITLQSEDPQATIYYSLDGSPPGPDTLLYQEPIRLTSRLSGLPLRAVAVTRGNSSPMAEGRYALRPGIVIHFKKPKHWSNAHLHYWGTEPHQLTSTWPGEPMHKDVGDWYVLQLPLQTSANVVFSDNGAPQTEDLQISQQEAWYDDGDWYPMDPIHFQRFRWPGGKTKALVVSMDDGNVQDRRLVTLLNRYKIRGSFHLNSGRLGQPTHVSAGEVSTLYANHEVSSHSVNHPHLTDLTPAEIEKELADDRKALEALSGKAVRGLAYPFGSHDKTVVDVAAKLGLIYGRVVPQTNDLRIPGDLLRWRGSCHQSDAYALGERLNNWSKPYLGLLFVWGHSWELDDGDPPNDWDGMEAFCKLVGNKQDIWYATAVEVAEYLLALRHVSISAHGDRAENGSTKTVWINTSGGVQELRAGGATTL